MGTILALFCLALMVVHPLLGFLVMTGVLCINAKLWLNEQGKPATKRFSPQSLRSPVKGPKA